MTIKNHGGVFGRNPTFKNVTIEGDITLDGTDIPDPSTIVLDSDIGTIASQDADSVNIDGGAIDGTAIGANTRSTGKFSTLDTTDDVIFYDDSGTSQDFVWDATNSRLGIKDTTPDNELAVNGVMTLANGAYQTAGFKNYSTNTIANGAVETLSIDLGLGDRFCGILIISMTRETSANLNTSRVYAYNIRSTSGTITQLFTANGSDGAGGFSVAVGSTGGTIDVTNSSGSAAFFSAFILQAQNF